MYLKNKNDLIYNGVYDVARPIHPMQLHTKSPMVCEGKDHFLCPSTVKL